MKRRKHNTNDLQGTIIGDYKLIEHSVKPDSRGRNQHWWKCLCKCGETVERRETRIMDNKLNKCSCWYKKRQLGVKSPLWRGCGEISGTYLSEVRLNARQHNLPFDITVELLWDMFIKQDRKCALTGVEIGFDIKKIEEDGSVSTTFQTASLDRINSKLGYTPDNVWWVHKDVNRMKNAYPMEEFVFFCHRVAERFPNPQTKENPDFVYMKNAKVN